MGLNTKARNRDAAAEQLFCSGQSPYDNMLYILCCQPLIRHFFQAQQLFFKYFRWFTSGTTCTIWCPSGHISTVLACNEARSLNGESRFFLGLWIRQDQITASFDQPTFGQQ